MQHGKAHVEAKYEAYRSASRDFACEKIATRFPELAGNVVFAGISDLAVGKAEGFQFPWRKLVGQNRPYLRRFELAVWYRDNLAALAIGRASRGPDNVTIHFVERSGGANPLAGWVALFAVEAADSYAKVIGRQRVKLKAPLAGVLPRYQAMGFRLAETINGATYYDRRVQP
ncbi:hypothetical protein [Azorhizobium doebereinerae]|uniref:hypothetical protein n=1 Tax=Azorhizobium doebereinerae TaxID=281091 RepID=UPI00048BD639|nr:hypothetical protein [Azorhizobium doebereinerae]